MFLLVAFNVLGLVNALGLAIEKPILLDGTAAEVGHTLITIREARFYGALQRFKVTSGDPLPMESEEELKKVVQKIIFEEMVYAEAKSFQFEGVPRLEAERMPRKEGKKTSLVFQEILSRFKKTESQAVDRLWKSLVVEKFIQKKVETLTPIVTDAEMERYYKQNLTRFKGSDYESLKPNIALLLKKQRVEKGLEEWVQILKDRYGVNNYLEERR